MSERNLSADSRAKTAVYPDWQPAAEASRERKAISAQSITIRIPRGTFRVLLVKPRYGDPWAVYATAPGVKVHDWKPTNLLIDRTRRWKAW